MRSGGDMASALGGLMACIAMLAGLLEHQKNQQPRGRRMDVSMVDSILFGLENQFSLYLKSGVVPKPKGNSYALINGVVLECSGGKFLAQDCDAAWQQKR